MAYNTEVADRLRKIIGGWKGVSEKTMFGGLSFLLDGKMFIGVLKYDLVVRVDPQESDMFVKKPHVRLMDFTGKPMKGFLYVSAKGYDSDEKLREWCDISMRFASTLPPKKKK